MTIVGFVVLVTFVIVFGLNLNPVPSGARILNESTLSELSLKGFNLSEGWHFLPADPPGATPANLPGEGWQDVDMSIFNPADWDGTGWFSHTFAIEDGVQAGDLALLTTQYGAMEIYLNGELLYRRGQIHEDGTVSGAVATRFPDPIPLPSTLSDGDRLLVRVHSDQLRDQLPILWQPMNQTWHPAGFTLAVGHYSDAEALIAARHRNNTLLLLAGFTLLILGFYHAYFHVMSRSMPAVRQYAVFAILAGLHSLLWYATNAVTPIGWLIPVYLARFALLFAGSFVGLHIIMELYQIARMRVLRAGFAATMLLVIGGLVAGIEGHGAAMLLFGVLTTMTLVWARIRHTSYIGFIMFGFHGHVVAPLYWLATYRFWMPGPVTMEAFWFLGGGVTYLILAYILASRHSALEREREQVYLEMLSLSDQADSMRDVLRRRTEEHQELTQFNESLTAELERQTKERLNAERQAAFGQVVQGIVHNLKGPLTTMVGNADVLNLQLTRLRNRIQEEEQPAEVIDQALVSLANPVDGIHRGGERLQGMIQNLLDKSRADRDRELSRFDLNDFVQAEMEFVRADKTLREHVQVSLDLHDGPLIVEAIRGEIAQVFENLLGNARDALYGQDDARITIRTLQRSGSACLEIVDNGPGVPADLAEKVFDPFFTTKPTHGSGENGSSEPKGTGLGLWMCRKAVDDNGGMLHLTEAPGGGAAFCVELPFREQQMARSA